MESEESQNEQTGADKKILVDLIPERYRFLRWWIRLMRPEKRGWMFALNVGSFFLIYILGWVVGFSIIFISNLMISLFITAFCVWSGVALVRHIHTIKKLAHQHVRDKIREQDELVPSFSFDFGEITPEGVSENPLWDLSQHLQDVVDEWLKYRDLEVIRDESSVSVGMTRQGWYSLTMGCYVRKKEGG